MHPSITGLLSALLSVPGTFKFSIPVCHFIFLKYAALVKAAEWLSQSHPYITGANPPLHSVMKYNVSTQGRKQVAQLEKAGDNLICPRGVKSAVTPPQSVQSQMNALSGGSTFLHQNAFRTPYFLRAQELC